MTEPATVLSFDAGPGAVRGAATESLDCLAAGFDARAPGGISHSRRVARLAASTAKRLGFSYGDIARVRRAAALHDIGKIRTPVKILNKPGLLSADERAVVERHAVDGAEMIASSGDEVVAVIARHHHERFDGSGYPDRLAGEEIPLASRIIAVADTFDAVTSVRPYRPAMPYGRALQMLRDEAGLQLDPRLVDVFVDRFSGPSGTAALRRVAFLS